MSSKQDDILNDQNLLLTNYFDMRQSVFEMFGYKEDWRSFPLEDCRDYYWRMVNETTIDYCDDEHFRDENTYRGYIYTYRHLSKYIYETTELTMCLIDTRCDFNIFLMVFSNEKKVI